MIAAFCLCLPARRDGSRAKGFFHKPYRVIQLVLQGQLNDVFGYAEHPVYFQIEFFGAFENRRQVFGDSAQLLIPVPRRDSDFRVQQRLVVFAFTILQKHQTGSLSAHFAGGTNGFER